MSRSEMKEWIIPKEREDKKENQIEEERKKCKSASS